MKLPLLLSLAAISISGVVLFQSLTTELTREPMAPVTKGSATGADSSGEIAALREAVERLSARLDAYENMPAPLVTPARIPAGAHLDKGDLDELRAELMAELKGAQKGPAAGTPGLKQDVAIALDEVRRNERRAAREAKATAAAEVLEKQMPYLQEQLGLTTSQTDGLRTVLQDREARQQEMWRLWEEGEREAVGAMKQQESEIFSGDLGAVLNEQQVEQFRSLRSRGGGKGGGGGGQGK